MTQQDLRSIGAAALEIWANAKDELCELDGAIGDGDLGITVSSGAHAVIEAWQRAEPDASVATVLKVAGKAFGSANPSTMAAFISTGTVSAAKALDGCEEPSRGDWSKALAAAIDTISRRGGAVPGDKTILDAMAPAAEALADETIGDSAVLAEMIRRAEEGVSRTRELQSQKGRAAWVGERSIGQQDPGATAFLRLLEAIDAALREIPTNEEHS